MHGVLVVDKPSGPTSHDLVSLARRAYQTRQVGHAGTLDPMASGVVLLMFGQACKLSQHLTGMHKRYVADVRFGTSTDSLDAEGEVIETRPLAPGWLDSAVLERALVAERSRSEQIPPAVSAIQVNGERAYRAARRGEPLQLPARAVRVNELCLIGASDEQLTLELDVSKGYYVRALARDLGQALGVPAHLARLRRLSSGAFNLNEAAGWPLTGAEPLLALTEVARRVMPTVVLTDDGLARARTGRALSRAHFEAEPPDAGVFAWLSADQELCALGQRGEADAFSVVRGFVPKP
ncbi:MAG: tRNA pseudouridine(55) synthase TruB [Myxococcales bacterium]|nr:tRNA pseudouridine(55) synthase TruB [Myxococcales bacterium]